MSDATSSTSSPLMFPAFLYGEHAACRRKMKAEAKKWAKWYEERGTFPEPKMIPVPPGSLMFCDRVPFNQNSHWYLYLVNEMLSDIGVMLAFKNEDTPMFREAQDKFACSYPWGAISLATHYPLYTTIPMVIRRLDAVLSFWDPLATLQYHDLRFKVHNLNDLLYYHCHGFIHTWVENALGRPTREVLREAVDHMRNASDEEVKAVQMRRFYHVADVDPELKHREWLKTPGLIEAELQRLEQMDYDWYEDLRAGASGSHSALLRKLDAKFPG